MPRRRIAAKVFVTVDGAFRRAATAVLGAGFAPITAVLTVVLVLTATLPADDLSDHTAPSFGETPVVAGDTPRVAGRTQSIAVAEQSSAGDIEFDPADPQLSAAELANIDEEEEAAAFGAAQVPAAEPALAAAAVAPSSDAVAAAALPKADDQDELWLVSSRCARCEPDGAVRLHYWRYVGGCWEKRTLADLLSADPSIRTCIHVHGNRCDFAKANAAGWSYYSTLTGGCVRRPPMRFIIFTWPSDRIQGSGRKDVQAKAVRAECHAWYLAWFVRQLSAETPLSMVGYSFGTRVIGGTLHLLGGGMLRGCSVGPALERPGIRVVMLAAAMDNTAFLPGQMFQCGSCLIDQLLVTRNTADPAMKWYPLMYRMMLFRRRGQQSLGYTGLAGLSCLPCLQGRVRHCDVTCAVGKEHDWSGCAYLMPGLSERMRQYIYQEPVGTPTSPAVPAEPTEESGSPIVPPTPFAAGPAAPALPAEDLTVTAP